MNRRIAAILGAATLGLGVGALAQTKTTPSTPSTTAPQPTPQTPSSDTTPNEGHVGQKGMAITTSMAGKHLALLNVYIDQAIVNTKALDSLASMDLPVSEQHMREAAKNLDLSLKGAMTHLGHIKKMNDPSFTRLTELDRALKDSKMTLGRLKKAKDADLDGQIDQLSSHLGAVQTIFRDMAKTANFTAIEDFNLNATVPVRGTSPGIDDSGMPQPSPTTSPQIPKSPENVAPPKHDTDMLPEPARPESPPSSTTPKYR